MKALVTALYLLAAVVNLLPGIGVSSAARLESFYGVSLADPTLAALMRHRAVLLAIVGALLAVAAFRPALRRAALWAGLASMLSFGLLVALAPAPLPTLRGVWIVDVVASLGLVAAALLERRARRRV